MKYFSTILLLFILNIQTFSYAAKPERRCITWNMQGAFDDSGSKWINVVAQMLQPAEGIDVIALQECGNLPTTAVETVNPPVLTKIIPNDRQEEEYLKEYVWRVQKHDFYIYHFNMGVRTSLAIVSRSRASETFESTALLGHRRPVIGIRVGVEDHFFNMHAGSHKGNEAAEQVLAIEYFMDNLLNSNTDLNWVTMGDFNRDPSEMQKGLKNTARPGIQRYIVHTPPNQPTQESGRVLDYAVVGRSASRAIGGGPGRKASLAVNYQRSSDHTPVYLSPKNYEL